MNLGGPIRWEAIDGLGKALMELSLLGLGWAWDVWAWEVLKAANVMPTAKMRPQHFIHPPESPEPRVAELRAPALPQFFRFSHFTMSRDQIPGS